MSTPGEQILIYALVKIRQEAMSAPLFDQKLFDSRNIAKLAIKGGDTLLWTMVAIIADDALQSYSETVKAQ